MGIRILPLFVFTFVLGLFPGVNLLSLTLEELVGAEQAAALVAGEKPVITQFSDPVPRLVPRYDALRSLVNTVREELDPGVMVETLQIYKKPPEAEKTVWSAAEVTRLYNNVLALSTLAGLQYYSASRGTMRTFYETSRVINNPSARTPIPDPVFSSPPSELTVYARQKDLTFGDNIYQYDFYTAPEAIFFVQQNLTTLTVTIIPAVGKNKLRSFVAVIDAGDHLLIYAASMARAISLPGMNTRVGNSFTNRAEAILTWFRERADMAFGTAR